MKLQTEVSIPTYLLGGGTCLLSKKMLELFGDNKRVERNKKTTRKEIRKMKRKSRKRKMKMTTTLIFSGMMMKMMKLPKLWKKKSRRIKEQLKKKLTKDQEL